MKKKKIVLAIVLFFNMIFINNLAKATVINVTPKNPKVGDTVTITVTVPNVHTASVTANVSGVVSGTIKVVAGDMSGNPGTYSQSANYKCTKEGTIVIKTTDSSRAVLNGAYVEAGASTSVAVTAKTTDTSSSNNNSGSNSNNSSNSNSNSNSNTGTTSSTQSKSSVATLGNLGIKPNDFKGFTPSKISYSTTVPDNVSSIEIYATKGQSGQTISGTGKKQLKDGQNNFEIKVTAEDGKTTKTYKLTVTKGKSSSTSEENNTENTTSQDEEENNSTDENSSDTEAEEQTLGLAELKIDGITLSPSFKKDVYEYTAKLKEDKDKLDVIATPITDGNKVEILGNDNLKDGENTITIIVSDESGENTATYQINVTKEKKEKTFLEKIMEKKKECLIIGALCVAIIVVVIILIVYHVHSKNDMYSGMYMTYKNGVTQHEDNHEDEIRKESKHVETKRKSKGKRFK